MTLPREAGGAATRSSAASASEHTPAERSALVIVGAGPAGMAAAVAAAEAGLTPLVVDETPRPGGQIYRQGPAAVSGAPPSGPGANLLGRFHQHRDRIEFLPETIAWGLFPPRRLALVRGGASWMIEAEQSILAPGAYEHAPPFPGWTLPGVMTPGAAQAMVKTMHVRPGNRALVAGTGPFLLVVAEQLHRSGVEVAGVVEMAPRGEVVRALPGLLAHPGLLWEGVRYLYRLRRAGVPVYHGHVLLEARGKDEVSEAVFAPCDAEGRPHRSRARVVGVDVVCSGYGFVPRIALAQLAGCRLRFDEARGGWIPEVDENLRTSIPGVGVAGDGGGVAGAMVAEIEGTLAGLAAACDLGAIDQKTFLAARKPLVRRLTRLMRFRAALDRLYRLRPGLVDLAGADTLVCRCEELTRAEVETGIAAGGADLRSLKVMTRLGMGPCQGMMCWPAMARLLAARTGISVEAAGPASVRPPIVPIGLESLCEPGGEEGLTCSSIPDVIVVGGGVIGCSTAWELTRRSVRVLLLDKSLPGRATSASAGGLWPVGEAVGLGCGVIYHAVGGASDSADAAGPTPLPEVFRDFLVASNARFPHLSEELLATAGVDIEFAPVGLLFLIFDEGQRGFAEGVGRSVPSGMRVEFLSPKEAIELEPRLTPDLLGAALLLGEHQINPILLAEGLKRAAMRKGCAFRHDTLATGLRRVGDRVVGVEVGDEFLPCGTVVNAAGAWAGRLAATAGFQVSVEPVRGQIVLTETLPRVLNSCLSSAACYLAQKKHGEVLIGSTTESAGFDVSVTPEAIGSLCRGAARAVPLLRRVRVKRTWAGLRPGTPDELPILGPMEGVEGYVNATGGFRTGIVASPLTGEVAAAVTCGETPSVAVEPFLQGRFDAMGQTRLREAAGQERRHA